MQSIKTDEHNIIKNILLGGEAKRRTLGVQRRSLWQDATPVVRQVSSCKEKPSSRLLSIQAKRLLPAWPIADVSASDASSFD